MTIPQVLRMYMVEKKLAAAQEDQPKPAIEIYPGPITETTDDEE